jgi:crotonobetainyl-CoA:carnitine CoA-transferase CaiB-like acyl-CoA transferase
MKVGVAVVDIHRGAQRGGGDSRRTHRRERDGEGELIEVSLLASAFAALVNVAAGALATGEEPRRYGNAHPSIVPYQAFSTADGRLAVAPANDGLFTKLCEALERSDLAADERYATNNARVRNREPLVAELESIFATRETEHWLGVLLSAGVPAGEIRDVRTALRVAGSAVTDADHPGSHS